MNGDLCQRWVWDLLPEGREWLVGGLVGWRVCWTDLEMSGTIVGEKKKSNKAQCLSAGIFMTELIWEEPGLRSLNLKPLLFCCNCFTFTFFIIARLILVAPSVTSSVSLALQYQPLSINRSYDRLPPLPLFHPSSWFHVSCFSFRLFLLGGRILELHGTELRLTQTGGKHRLRGKKQQEEDFTLEQRQTTGECVCAACWCAVTELICVSPFDENEVKGQWQPWLDFFFKRQEGIEVISLYLTIGSSSIVNSGSDPSLPLTHRCAPAIRKQCKLARNMKKTTRRTQGHSRTKTHTNSRLSGLFMFLSWSVVTLCSAALRHAVSDVTDISSVNSEASNQ